MKQVFFTIILLLTVTMSVTVFATKIDDDTHITVKGIVYDENGKPLPGASVIIVGTTFGVGTNSNGEFIIAMDEKGKQLLRVSFVGYKSQEISTSEVENMGKKVEIRLMPADNMLNEVVVTGNVLEKPLKEVPVLTRIITHKDIQVVNPLNVETLLQYQLPGLQIGYNSMSQQPEIKYQGVDGEYMLFLIDGERISGEGTDHNVDFSRFNVDDIDRIEVIRGSQSTIYGSNALGGVINIITKNANRPFTGNVNMRYAGINGRKYSVSAGTKQSRFSSLTSLSYRQKDTYTISDNDAKTSTSVDSEGNTTQQTADTASTTIYGYSIWDASQKFGYAFTNKLSANVKGSFYHNEREIRTGQKYQESYLDYAVSGRIRYIPKSNQQLTLSYVYDTYKKDKDFFKAGFTRTDYRNRTQTARLDYSIVLNKHTVSTGLESESEYLKHYMLKDSSDAHNETYSIYLQEEWKIVDNVDIIAGLRGDYHSKYHLHVTPKLSAMYHPTKAITLRAGYSQGFRSPSIKELFQEYDMGGLGWFMLYGNADLKPETSHQYSLSAEINVKGINLSTSAYHNRFKNKITYASVGDGSGDLRYVNAKNAKTTGLEAIMRTKLNMGMTLSGSYAYVDDYQEVDGKNTSSMRPHSITFSAIYAHRFEKIGLTLALNGQWGSKLATYTFSTDGSYKLTRYDARFLCNFSASAQLQRGVLLSLGIDNLFNYKDKAADSSLQLPQKGLSLVGSLNINIADMLKL